VDLVLVEVDLVNKWSQDGKIGEQTIFYKHFDKHGIIDNARVNWWSACGLSACWSGLSEQMIFYKHFHKHGIIDNARVNWWSACGLSACWSQHRNFVEQMIFYKHFDKHGIIDNPRVKRSRKKKGYILTNVAKHL